MAFFHCKQCGIQKEVPDTFTGKPVRCPSCKQAVTISANADADAPLHEAARKDTFPAPAGMPDKATTSPTGRQQDPATPQRPSQSVEINSTQTAEKRSFMHGGLLSNLKAGLEGGLLLLFFCITIATLIQEAAPSSASYGMILSMGLISSTVFCITMSLRGRLPVVAAGPETVVCGLLYLFATFIQSQSPNMTIEATGVTLLAGLVLCALFTGLVSQFAATMDAGSILRFIPQPVIGGILAMVGVLLINGALQLSALDPFCIKALLPALGVEPCLKWIPAASFGLLLTLVLYRSKNALLNIALILLSAAVSHALLRYWGFSIAEAQNMNLLLQPALVPLPWQSTSMEMLTSIRWDILLKGAPYLIAITILVTFSLAQKVYALELLIEDEVDLNGLLKNLATANTLSAFAGGLPGSISLTRSIGSGFGSKTGPIAGITAGLVCGSAIFWLGPLLGYLPRFVPAGLLVFFGLSILRKWLVDAKRGFTRIDDYVLLVLVFLISVAFGILAGMAAGFLFSILVLANRYSKVTVIKHLLNGSTNRSRVDRGAEHLAILRTHGNQIFMMRLQGFIFLGSTTPILAAIRNRLRNENEPPLRYMIIDFSRVSGLASQVAISFTQFKTLARKSGFTLLFTNVPFEVEQQLEENGFTLNEPDGTSMSFVEMDYALEWCEDSILKEAGANALADKGLEDMLSPVFPDPDKLPLLMSYLEKMSFTSKEHIFRQGDTADAMYFIEQGMITIQLELDGRKTTRVKKMGPGTVFGEMGIYTNAPRSASAVAEGTCVLYRLSRTTLDQLQLKEPLLTSALHRFVVNLLSQRVSDANHHVMDLLR
ncbi:cyclic nucleotide-binding domain-containing protein [Desulfovibrio mangrovi]|uniref:SLC26A/SulP transporter family protein n=1 Tax=Desulfovibrio mangrovi TaxID=2976983 RepID=UPI002247AEA6|nr:cyclic nucleotide-binding domain-containing protein [Desulfovibrio mangrovi]UZP68089.1 cyclic nucleotide-binding domain-containing protein [Desulfovibrio mangrovi]